MRKLCFALFALSFTLSACGPPDDRLTSYQKSGTYGVDGKCTEPVAAVTTERDGKFDVAPATASASLVEPKELGIFSTAEHVVELETEYRLFLCGRAYPARRVRDAGVADVGFLRITGDFDPSTFPEPYEIAESVQVGEQVFIRGVHMHPEGLWEDKVIHRITENYYGIRITKPYQGSTRPWEFVYDDLSALIVDKDTTTSNSSVHNRRAGELNDVVLRNFTARAIHDHVISFGGLSGGPTVNRRGQQVGVNSTELSNEGIIVLERDGQLHYYPRVTINLLPADELKRALERIR